MAPFMLSQDNIELQFATNHLGHFLLTNLVLDNMKKTAIESQREGRIVNISSLGHHHVYPQGIHFDKDKINDSSRFEERVEITANSLHPGAIATNLLRHTGIIGDGAATTCYVALSPQVKGVSGEYFADSNVATRSQFASDVELAKKLWDFSIDLTRSE
ncbi:hypothetical protein CASFOL_036847 [Castilleja foliolosa]|uniref:Short-chain dehydrogenase TIC 32, chloroplastic n=1 Tax=Castilleja foliolosa TaxID=1961234 RepID=A0ABD3BRD5_9LAMI